MHLEVLTREQRKLLPLIKLFAKEYYLVGGTAIALQLGHRRSIDFDLFTGKGIKKQSIKNLIVKKNYAVEALLFEDSEQLHLIINTVKITFYNYPYPIVPQVDLQGMIKSPTLLDLAAMKAFALGGRAKWKDYVDLYFLMKTSFALKDISQRAEAIFGNFFNGKLFREQLCFYKDIDYTENLEYLGPALENKLIKSYLTAQALTPF